MLKVVFQSMSEVASFSKVYRGYHRVQAKLASMPSVQKYVLLSFRLVCLRRGTILAQLGSKSSTTRRVDTAPFANLAQCNAHQLGFCVLFMQAVPDRFAWLICSRGIFQGAHCSRAMPPHGHCGGRERIGSSLWPKALRAGRPETSLLSHLPTPSLA